MSTILVTDVPPPIRRVLGRLLEAEGHVCVFAGDGEDALRMVRDGRPDLALIDVEMPRRSGLEVLAALRQDAETRATRVILTCAGAWLAPRWACCLAGRRSGSARLGRPPTDARRPRQAEAVRTYHYRYQLG